MVFKDMKNIWPRLLALVPGIVLVCIGLFDPRESAFSSGRAPVVAAGLVFAFVGAAFLINGLKTPYREALLALNTSFLLGAFALAPVAIVWHSGFSWPLAGSGIACLGIMAVCLRAAYRAYRQAVGARKAD